MAAPSAGPRQDVSWPAQVGETEDLALAGGRSPDENRWERLHWASSLVTHAVAGLSGNESLAVIRGPATRT